MTNDKTTVRDLQIRGHSWRNYEPEEFIEAANADGKEESRKQLTAVEGGRFYPMLKDAQKFVRNLDKADKQQWMQANPEMAEWVEVLLYLVGYPEVETNTENPLSRSLPYAEQRPQEFIEFAEREGKFEARKRMRAVENGRFNDLLKSGHKHFRHLDPDEMRGWSDANPELMEWLGVWGYLEDLITWPQHTGIEQKL